MYIAETLHIPIDEVAVYWTEIEGFKLNTTSLVPLISLFTMLIPFFFIFAGSKLTPLWSSMQMGRDLMLIWLRYKIGAWKLLRKGD